MVEPCVIRRRWWQCERCESRLGEVTPDGAAVIILLHPKRRYVVPLAGAGVQTVCRCGAAQTLTPDIARRIARPA